MKAFLSLRWVFGETPQYRLVKISLMMGLYAGRAADKWPDPAASIRSGPSWKKQEPDRPFHFVTQGMKEAEKPAALGPDSAGAWDSLNYYWFQWERKATQHLSGSGLSTYWWGGGGVGRHGISLPWVGHQAALQGMCRARGPPLLVYFTGAGLVLRFPHADQSIKEFCQPCLLQGPDPAWAERPHLHWSQWQLRALNTYPEVLSALQDCTLVLSARERLKCWLTTLQAFWAQGYVWVCRRAGALSY